MGQPGIPAELELELRRLQHGQHLCLLYDDPADNWATIVSYFREGLARGERCLFGGDGDDARELVQRLASVGIDVERETQRGALGILNTSGPLSHEPTVELDLLEHAANQALRDGFKGLRFSREARYEKPFDEHGILEIEALLNDVIPRHPLIHICRFNLGRWPPSLIQEILRVHPIAVIGPLVCPNTYYEPPQMALGRCPEEERTRWMLKQLYKSRAAKLALERAVQARDEFLSAASHELRTPLTSTRLHVQSVLRSAKHSANDHVSASAVAGKLQRADAQLNKLVEVIQRLLDASQILEDGRIELHLEDVDLRDVVRQVIARYDDREKHGCTLQFDSRRNRLWAAGTASGSSRWLSTSSRTPSSSGQENRSRSTFPATAPGQGWSCATWGSGSPPRTSREFSIASSEVSLSFTMVASVSASGS